MPPAAVVISLLGTWRTIAEVEADAHQLACVVVEIGFTTVGCATLCSGITRTYWAMRALAALPPIAAGPVARAAPADAGRINSLDRKAKSHYHRYLNKSHYKPPRYHVAPPVDDLLPLRHRLCSKFYVLRVLRSAADLGTCCLYGPIERFLKLDHWHRALKAFGHLHPAIPLDYTKKPSWCAGYAECLR